jgi:hypothetical protein
MSHDQWLQWLAEQIMDLRERVAALETTGKGRSLAWLAAVPWKIVLTLLVSSALLITGHMSVPELKVLLGLTRGE